MIAALYKSWQGEEFITQSLDSIYAQVGVIVFVHSEINWMGERGEGNTIRARVREWQRDHDPDGKVIHLDSDSTDSAAQYSMGMTWIQRQRPDCSHVLIIDTDEVWDADQLALLIRAGQAHPDKDAFTGRFWAYIKSPLYRVVPQEPYRPLVMIKNSGVFPPLCRGAGAGNVYHTGLSLHHYTFVRDSVERIVMKMRTSAADDQAASHEAERWIREVWENIPQVMNFHHTIGAENCWKGIEKIDLSQVPEAMREVAPIYHERWK